MTARQKFWLKVVLAVTFPLWILPAAVVALVVVVCLMCWEAADSIVDPKPRPMGGKRFP